MYKVYFIALLYFGFMATFGIHMHMGMSKGAMFVYFAIVCVALVGVLVEHLFTWQRRRKAYKDFNSYAKNARSEEKA